MATLRIFRDEGNRSDRQKARLMWVIEAYGVAAWREKLLSEPALAGVRVEREQPAPSTPHTRRELLGVHKQPNGRLRVGLHVPTGRLSVDEARQIARLADTYSEGEIRLTVEQNALLPNVDPEALHALLEEECLGAESRLSVYPGNIVGHTVSCTGSQVCARLEGSAWGGCVGGMAASDSVAARAFSAAYPTSLGALHLNELPRVHASVPHPNAQFCGLAMIETKQNADRVATKLDALISMPRPLRIHWTGCPNSCGQVQAADVRRGPPSLSLCRQRARCGPL